MLGFLRKKASAGTPKTFEVSPHVRATEHEDGIVFLHLRSGTILKSNRTGAMIWNGLAESRPVEEIASELSRRHALPRGQALADAREFMSELEARSLIVRRGKSA